MKIVEKALKSILELVCKKKPANLDEAKGMLAIIEVIAENALGEAKADKAEAA